MGAFPITPVILPICPPVQQDARRRGNEFQPSSEPASTVALLRRDARRMPYARSIVFLIPSFQPNDILFGLIEELRRASAAPVVIVDDGSGAGYAPILDRVRQVANVTVLTNAVNLGKGSALKHGMNHILVHHPD